MGGPGVFPPMSALSPANCTWKALSLLLRVKPRAFMCPSVLSGQVCCPVFVHSGLKATLLSRLRFLALGGGQLNSPEGDGEQLCFALFIAGHGPFRCRFAICVQ